VVILGAAESSNVMAASLRQGADGYLPRDISAEALARSLHGVTHGEVAVPRALV
jgi:DNA-binding NarL/FixJ family response regulator